MNEFPMWNIGIVNGIETTYEVHWLEWDTAMVTVDGGTKGHLPTAVRTHHCCLGYS